MQNTPKLLIGKPKVMRELAQSRQDGVQTRPNLILRSKSRGSKDAATGRIIRGARVTLAVNRLPSLEPTALYGIGADRRFIKFGYARDPQRRLLELQSGSPIDLELLGAIILRDQALAIELERAVHIAASDFHVRGEWFRSTPRTLMFVEWMRLSLEKFEELIRAVSADIERRLEGRTPECLRTRLRPRP
ncbi:MAG: GIY-YIG nuclease family protein [Steroidobacteraceae bacterium]